MRVEPAPRIEVRKDLNTSISGRFCHRAAATLPRSFVMPATYCVR